MILTGQHYVLCRRRTPPGGLCRVWLALGLATSLKAQNAEPILKLTPAEQAAVEQNPALKEQYLRLARAQELLLAEARKADWEKQPDVQLLMERAREKALAESWLESVSAPPPEYPSEAELLAAWEQRKAAFATPRQHRLAQIFIACPKGADKATAAKAEAKLAQLRKRLASADEDFATIAATASEDRSSAPRGGEIGWLSDAQIQPELRTPVVRLLQHEISAPLRLNDGWHILKCLDRREAKEPSLAEARTALAQQLRAEKARANSEAYVAQLLQAAAQQDTETAQSAGNAPRAN